jgi:ubiquitin-conjugating enzyme E2 D/E
MNPTVAQRRLTKELDEFHAKRASTLGVAVSLADAHTWLGYVQGKPGSPFETHTLVLQIRFPVDYPFKPPTVTFLTPVPDGARLKAMVHAGPDGESVCPHCFPMIKREWSPARLVHQVLQALQDLCDVAEPTPRACEHASQSVNVV